MLSSDILWANPASLGPAVEQSVYPSFSGFGRVEKISSQVFKAGSPVVYHIQDAHAVFEAQKNMAKLIEILVQRQGIDLVLVEGGTGNASLSPLRRVAWKKVRQRVAEDFLKQGKITGEEYLQLATDYPFEL